MKEVNNNHKADFLFELGCEELPSAAVLSLSEALVIQVEKLLEKAGLTYAAITPFATPRRLALRISQLIGAQAPQTVSRRGPAVAAAYDSAGNPTQALLGFAKSCGVEVSAMSVIKTDKGEWLNFEATNPGLNTIQLLPTILKEAIAALPIAKPMRWGGGDNEFARPVHWLVMLYENEIVPAELFGVKSGQESYGHRFHHPQPVFIANAAQYETAMSEACVVVDFIRRRQMIRDQIAVIEEQLGAKAVASDALLDEVTSIVEWPKVLLVGFDKQFLEIPKEVLIASMESHQKCFALIDKNEKLLPHFITVANLNSQNQQQVIAGNAKVMRARLSDAAFFYETDRKTPLSAHVEATKKVIFQAKLGTLYDKAERLKALIQVLVTPLQLNVKEAQQAASLSKCDLMTGMVSEFPELQGLMGYYYAQLDGESVEVAIALNEQYMPRFAADHLPESALGSALSLADRLDTLVGAFILGDKPSGVKDPFKLRRHALAVARLLLNNPAPLSLSNLIQQATISFQSLKTEKSQLSELQSFILERLTAYYQAQGIAADRVNAVLARQNDNLYDFNQRLQALAGFIQLPEAVTLSAACKRVNNLLNSAGASAQNISIDKALLQENAEINLVKHLDTVAAKVAVLEQSQDYSAILALLPSLATHVDAFFEQVMVLVEEDCLKKNRLALLRHLQALLQHVADISLLQ